MPPFLRKAVLALILAMAHWIDAQEGAAPFPSSENEAAEIIISSNTLAFDLYVKLKDENLVFSPYGLTVSLGMAYAGAQGSTRAQMARILHFPPQLTSMLQAFAALTDRFNHITRRSADAFFLNIASSLWVERSYPIRSDFKKRIAEGGQAVFKSVDFSRSTEAARTDINNWIRERSQGKINELFGRGQIDRNTELLLASTVYLKARWLRFFDTALTRQTPFFPNRDLSLTVPMMTVTGRFGYYKGEAFTLLELPYDMRHSSDLEISMFIFLPQDRNGLSQLERQLDSTKLRTWRELLKEKRVIVSLPKFKITSSLNLVSALDELGLSLPFSDRANFSGIRESGNLKISQVLQKTYLSVDEKGTEAVAASGVSLGVKGLNVEASEVFLADHPFLYLVVEKKTGVILFIGRVSQPNAFN